ncbi:MAG: glycine--tRNA ligase subunit beta [Candidatus Eisenbacteria bacterium]
MTKHLLIEIGTEEIPAGYVPPALRAFAETLARRLSEGRVAHGAVETFATPRRLALRISDVEEMQPDAEREVTGPPARIAFDESGNPTKAALGFAKTNGVAVEDLRKVETEKGEYIAVTVTDRGRPLADLLGDLIPEIVASLPFPKTMRWESTGFLFARPIEWIVALHGEGVVPVEIAGVSSGRMSRGHRVLHPEPVTIESPESYEEALRKGGVIVSEEERRAKIEAEIGRVLAGTGGRVIADPGLLAEVAYLVEMPRGIAGRFDERFLDLPEKVVTTAMRSHQRYFAVAGEDGALQARFVTLANGVAGDESGVREGNERVLAARLSDAEFYWNEDRALSPSDRVESLGRMVWQEGMGSLLEKTRRLETLAGKIAAEAAPSAKETAVRAALLSKTDLTSEMIKDGKEFTALQGYMGMEYALAAGEPEDVARAIREQYLPRFAGDELPATDGGLVLSLADRTDNILGCLAAGFAPTGSQDPYGLRRQAIGVLRILAEERTALPLRRLLEIGAESYGDRLNDPPKTIETALALFRGRLRNMLVEKGLPYDVVEGVLETGFDRPADVERRALAIQDFRESESFVKLVLGFKRVVNILKGTGETGAPDPSLFREDEEKALFEAAESLRAPYEGSLERAEYREAMERLLTLRDPIDRFFEKVLVMDKDQKVRANRIALLRGVSQLFLRLADLSKVVLEGEKT